MKSEGKGGGIMTRKGTQKTKKGYPCILRPAYQTEKGASEEAMHMVTRFYSSQRGSGGGKVNKKKQTDSHPHRTRTKRKEENKEEKRGEGNA